MSNTVCIRNGRIIDPSTGRDEAGDLYLRDGRIIEPAAATGREVETVDAGGLVVAPGLVDIHVHLREPGQTHKEDIQSGTRAAAAGGFTTIVCMPNTQPTVDNAGTIRLILDACRRSALVNVLPTGCLTVGMKGEQLAPIGSLHAAGIVAVTDDGACVQDNEIMRRAVEYANMFGLPVMDHCQDYAMTRGAVMNEGSWSLRLGLKGWPSAAEEIVIARNIIISQYTGAHIHMQHVSTRNGVDLIRKARDRGIKVSGEAMPHHMFFTDEDCRDYNTNFKMNPPLRGADDREAVIEGVLDGTLEVIATDHAPHSPDEKEGEFDQAPFGVIGLETALGACLEVLHHAKKCDLSFMLARLTCLPAGILNLPKGTLQPGADADIVVFDPNEPWKVDTRTFQSKSRNCPWEGRTLHGRVHQTWVAGKQVWDARKGICT